MHGENLWATAHKRGIRSLGRPRQIEFIEQRTGEERMQREREGERERGRERERERERERVSPLSLHLGMHQGMREATATPGKELL